MLVYIRTLRKTLFLVLCCALAHIGRTFVPGNQKNSAMTGYLITLGLAALAIWLLVDSAVEFVQDSQEDTLATEP